MRKRILVVDNDAANVNVLRKLLEGEYELNSAGNGEECLEKMKEFGPDLVLLETVMPGIDGYETCEQIKSAPGGELAKVVLVSARASTEARLRGYDVGADDFVVKPFDPDEVLAKVRVQFRLRDTLLELALAQSQLAIQNSQLEELVRQRTREVVAMRDVTVFALAKLAESRDPETGEHLERMRAYSRILGEQLAAEGPYTNDIDQEFLGNLYRSSPLHDIGKVGVPDAILLKPGRLSDAEFAIMKRHTLIGAEALQSSIGHTGSGGFLGMGADIARSHHERFDGSGYPGGLVRRDIPLAARIVALADVYDALTSVRVYKSAFEPVVARAMIEQENEKHFDPAVVDAFLARWDDLLQVRDQIASQQPELVGVGDPGE